jgi:uncharacterized protein HemY
MTPPQPASDAGQREWLSGSRDKDPSRLIWPILLVAVIVAIVGYCAAKPVYRAIKSVRGARLAREGEKSLDSRSLEAAGRSLKLALSVAPKNPEVLRLAARYCTYTSRTDALNYWQMLVGTPDATLADQQQFVLYCQDLGRFDLAAQTLEGLSGQWLRDRSTQLLIIKQAVAIGNTSLAEEIAVTNLAVFPADPDFQFAFASAALARRDLAQTPRSIQLLRALAHGKSEQQIPALRLLASTEALPVADAEWAAAELKGRTNAPIGDVLLAYDVLGRVHAEKRLDYLRDAVAWVTPNGRVANIAAVITWLRGHGSPGLAMTLISDSRAATNEALTMLNVELLGSQGKWPQIETAVSQTNSPLSPLSKASIRAVLAVNRGDDAAADAAIYEAHRLAGNRLESLEEISRLAFALGRAKAGLEVAVRLLADPRTRVFTAEALLRIARKRDDYEIERLVFRNVAAELGSRALEEKAYVEILDGENPATVSQELAELLKTQPERASLRAVAAFAAFKSNKADDALRLMESSGVDWQRQEARWQLIHAMVLQAGKMKTASRSVAAQINPSTLRGPERDLLRTLLLSF